MGFGKLEVVKFSDHASFSPGLISLGCRQQSREDLGRLYSQEEVLSRGPGGDGRWL